MDLESDQFLARRAVPDSHRLVKAPRSQALPVRARGHTPHPASMAFERDKLLACGTVPHFHRFVTARRGQAFSVRTERQTRHLIADMALARNQLLARRA